mgnify:CR=1 FL=1|jgi:hypothetical protein|tara:strand:+ start:91 stop:348 length:258 start_codon:yes stop_codon:yes gene_type:complete
MKKTNTKDKKLPTFLKGSCHDPDTGNHTLSFRFKNHEDCTYYFKTGAEKISFFAGLQEGSQLGGEGYLRIYSTKVAKTEKEAEEC